MFAYIDKTDKYGITHRNYFLTQGDSFTLTASDEGKGLIKDIVFKLGRIGDNEYDIDEFYRHHYTLADDGVWYLFVETEDTVGFEVTGDNEPYIYEIEVKYIDDAIETVSQANFTVWKQMNKEGEDGE